jgi:predicted  nucleic acid-binding Zn-ribbon protein
VNNELEALLALQADDVVIHGLEERLAALEPRIRELDQRRSRVADAVARSEAAVGAEEKKQAWVREKIAEHKALIERNAAQMDAVTNMKMATAAMAQMEQAKAIVVAEEGDLLAINRKLEELRTVLQGQQGELATLTAAQETARSEVATERAQIDGELAVARQKRDGQAQHVSTALRSKYDRIRVRRKPEAVFAMNGYSCGACDTAIPMQRRHIMSNTGAIEVCEGCGVLMYFPV